MPTVERDDLPVKRVGKENPQVNAQQKTRWKRDGWEASVRIGGEAFIHVAMRRLMVRRLARP